MPISILIARFHLLSNSPKLRHATPPRLELPYVDPYDWPRVLQFFAGRATLGVEAVEDGAYRRAIEWLGDAGTLSVTRHATKPCLVATLEGAANRHSKAIGEHLTRLFDSQADAPAIAAP